MLAVLAVPVVGMREWELERELEPGEVLGLTRTTLLLRRRLTPVVRTTLTSPRVRRVVEEEEEEEEEREEREEQGRGRLATNPA